MEEQILENVRLLAVDVDGTLLTTEHRVPLEVRQAFAEARAAGLILVLASARSPDALRAVLADLEHRGPCVCFSGGWTGTIDPHGTEVSVQQQKVIPLPAAEFIAKAVTAGGLVPNWFTGKGWAVPRLAPEVEFEMQVVGQRPVISDDLTSEGAPNKILVIGPHARLDKLRGELLNEQSMELEMVFSHDSYLEMLPKGVDKAGAVFALAERLGIPGEAVAAVGDAQNDVGMVRAAGFGVAMANATDEVRRVARHVTESNDRAGVAKLIEMILAAHLA